ncbi:hypothetical protein AB0D11_47945 [Streptomyces monashensis]|uniref:hypothetical protein n=1 Tax=Streptomyces monashensis TaxID=1678012 RepID=UPI0033F786A9
MRTRVRKDTVRSAPEPSHGSVQSRAKELARLRAESQRLLKAGIEWQLVREIVLRAAACSARYWVSPAPAATGTRPPDSARGRNINRKRATRLIRVNQIVGRHLRRTKRTVIADRTAPPAPDLVIRALTAKTLNTR